MYRYCHLLLVFLLFSTTSLKAQDEELRYHDNVYLDNIKSVKFHPLGDPLAPPIVNIERTEVLVLYFDDLSVDDGIKNYTYEIVHCTKNWQPSNLNDTEYLDGFAENTVEEVANSFGTRVPYTHYRLYLPNEDISCTLSGNYLLKIYEDEDDKRLAITRRFMIYDRRVAVAAQQSGTAKVEKRNTHQEIDIVVTDKNEVVRYPQTELSAVVMQNFRTDNAITDLKPLFVNRASISFDYQDKIVFPAGNEFRFFDIRRLTSRGRGVAQLQTYGNGYEVDLIPGQKRVRKPYLTYLDANGQFVVGEDNTFGLSSELRDSTGLDQFDLLNIQEQNDIRDIHLRADYADVLFRLESAGEMQDAEVYVFGALTDWQLKPEYKMTYSEDAQVYYLNRLLKQGYYNYQYVVVENGEIDISVTEGNFYETRNEYAVLIYYRPFGSRYDQLIEYSTFLFPR